MVKKIIFLLLGFSLVACEPKTHDIPNEASIIDMYPEFFIPTANFVGIYVDYDSDAFIFQYNLQADKMRLKPAYIQEIMKTGKWKFIQEENKEKDMNWLSFRRVDEEKHRYKGLHSLEILKIVHCGEYIIFGAIQSDFREMDRLVANYSDGGKWYRSNFWPLFSKYTDEVCI